MTSLADVIERGLSPLTPQQLADLALYADQQARVARRRGDMPEALAHGRECERICDYLNRTANGG